MKLSTPIGAIVAVGLDAPVGDVAIAAVTISPDIDKVVSLELENAGSSQSLWVVHATAGRIFRITSEFDSMKGIFSFKAAKSGLLSTPDALFGNKFKTIAELADFSKVVGFCPTSHEDMFGRTLTATANLERIMRKDSPTIAMVIGDIQGGASSFESRTNELWANSSKAVPSKCCDISSDLFKSFSSEEVLRVIAARLIAESLAAAVRAARVSDLATLYPALRLNENWGFGDASLYSGLKYYTNMNERGFRGTLTEKWIEWFESNGTAPDTPWFPSEQDETPSTVSADQLVSWSPAIKQDSKGRKIIAFDEAKANFMVKRLVEDSNEHGHTWVKWLKQFVPSVELQLKSKRRLSGRQMYLVWQKYTELIL